jgi:hypothetical protein
LRHIWYVKVKDGVKGHKQAIEKVRVFAGDQPWDREEIGCASARFDVLQSLIN